MFYRKIQIYFYILSSTKKITFITIQARDNEWKYTIWMINEVII